MIKIKMLTGKKIDKKNEKIVEFVSNFKYTKK